MGGITDAMWRAVSSRPKQADCAQLTEEKSTRNHALWTAVSHQFRIGACAASMGDALGAKKRAAKSWLELAGCAWLTEDEAAPGSRALSKAVTLGRVCEVCAVNMEDTTCATRRAAKRRHKEAGAARLTEEATRSCALGRAASLCHTPAVFAASMGEEPSAQWKAAQRQLRRGACAASMEDILIAAWRIA
jgi:hypothetical protein